LEALGSMRSRKPRYRILVINPGSTSTKIAVFEDEKLAYEETIRHSAHEFAGMKTVAEQYAARRDLILASLDRAGIELAGIDAVAARGGLLEPMEGGTYSVNAKMVRHLKRARRGEHASNLGGLIADSLSKRLKIPAFVTDPVAVDEMDEVARVSGLPEIQRQSLWHALNIRRVARIVARRIGKPLGRINLVVAHLGGGISVVPLRHGRCVDVNNAISGGPFSPERAGGLPTIEFMHWALAKTADHKTTEKDLFKILTGRAGVVAYLGTNDMKRVESQVRIGKKKPKLIWDAMVYQISKEIGAMSTALDGSVEAIVLTGGLGYSKKLVADVRRRVGFIARVIAFPGEDEFRALAEGALRVLEGEEKAKVY
jgi:butyrate kinase